MQVIENNQIKEKVYIEKLDNGLVVMILPKKTRKKYIVWSTNFGAIDNKFYAPGESDLTTVPDGIAHYLEHKLFEQENGRNSLDVLTSIGVDANAYTTNDHTAYLYECTDHFDEALDEFMNYVQNPYFTDENVEKEKGITFSSPNCSSIFEKSILLLSILAGVPVLNLRNSIPIEAKESDK